MLPSNYVDWLSKVREDGGEFAWIRDRPSADVNRDRRTREQLVKRVLDSLNNAVKSMAAETGQTEEELWTEANEIMQNMAHSFGLTSTKAVGYLVLKCLMRLLDKVMVNFEALKQVREIAKRDSVVFMPTHRTYVDFLLISLLCYDQNLKLPAICAGADFLSSKFVGEALRRCGAFFIRRSFGSLKARLASGELRETLRKRGNYANLLKCFVDKDGNQEDFVQCVFCTAVYSVDSRNSIKNHMEKEHPNANLNKTTENSQILDDIIRMATEEHENFEEFAQGPIVFSSNNHDFVGNDMSDPHLNGFDIGGHLSDIFTRFVIAEPRALNIIATNTFENLIQNVVEATRDIPQHVLHSTLSEVIPASIHVDQAIHDQYIDMHARNVEPLIQMANNNGFALTASTSSDHIALTAHFFDSEWNLRHFVLKVSYVLRSEAFGTKISDKNLQQVVVNRLRQAGLTGNYYLVAGDQSFEVLNFDTCLPCCVQILSRIGRQFRTVASSTNLVENVREISDVIQNVVHFIYRLRSYRKVREALRGYLLLPISDQWKSEFESIDAYLQNAEKIEEILEASSPDLLAEHKNLIAKYKDELNAYLQVARPIVKFITKLENPDQVTSCFILPVFAQLWYQFKNPSGNSQYIKKLSATALELLEKEQEALDEKIMFISAYLDPSVYRKLRELCKKVPKYSMDAIIGCVKAEASKILPDIADVKPVIESTDFDLFADTPKVSSLQQELNNYELLAGNSSNDANFWRRFEQSLPTLSQLAKFYHCVPASAVSSRKVLADFNCALNGSSQNTEQISELIELKSFMHF